MGYIQKLVEDKLEDLEESLENRLYYKESLEKQLENVNGHIEKTVRTITGLKREWEGYKTLEKEKGTLKEQKEKLETGLNFYAKEDHYSYAYGEYEHVEDGEYARKILEEVKNVGC